MQALARRQADWLERMRTQAFPHWREVEAGRREPDNRTAISVAVPFEAEWLTRNSGIVGKMVRSISDYRTWHDLPILADALEDAGCDDRHILDHLRAEIQHSAACWVVNGLLARLPAEKE